MLQASGHINPMHYPIWMVDYEASLVDARRGSDLAGAAIVLRALLGSIPNQSVKPKATKAMAESLSELLKTMIGG